MFIYFFNYQLRFSGFDDEWHCKNIKDIGKIISGGTPKTTVEEYWNGEINWFTPSELNNQKYLYESERKITQKGLNNSSAKLLPINSILISSRATVGEVAINKTESTTNQDFETIIPNKEMYNDFIYYSIIHLKNELLKMSYGSTFLSITKTDLGKIKLNYPQFNEQKKISDFLNQIDNKIQLLKEKHENYQNFKKYLMQQIFAQKLRFDKTSEWETFALNDIGKTYNGLSGLSKDNFEKGNSKYITYKSIFDNNILKSDFTENVDLNNKSQNEVKKGDLFFTGSSETPEEVGMVSVLNSTVEDCYLNSFCFGFRLNNKYDINPLFLAYYLRSPIMRNKIMILAQGSTRFNLSKKEILKLKIEIPSISEQQQIIDLFQNVDNKINEISMQTDNFNEFKKGLLQQMFVYIYIRIKFLISVRKSVASNIS